MVDNIVRLGDLIKVEGLNPMNIGRIYSGGKP